MRFKLFMILILVFCIFVAEARRKPAKGKRPKPKPKPPKPKPTQPSLITKPNLKIFRKYTRKSTGGRCWWDLTRTDCALCRRGGRACGFPLHRFCYKAGAAGCPGLPSHRYTLSTVGAPCYWNPADHNCAWCSVGQDCRHTPHCDIHASCLPYRMLGKIMLHKCVCNAAFVGNGIQCADRNGTIGAREEVAELELSVHNKYFVFAPGSPEFPFTDSGRSVEDL